MKLNSDNVVIQDLLLRIDATRRLINYTGPWSEPAKIFVDHLDRLHILLKEEILKDNEQTIST